MKITPEENKAAREALERQEPFACHGCSNPVPCAKCPPARAALRHEREARAYKRERTAAIDRIKALGLPDPIPLDAVASFLPDNPEWARYCARGGAR